jgi:hypothetical protein
VLPKPGKEPGRTQRLIRGVIDFGARRLPA